MDLVVGTPTSAHRARSNHSINTRRTNARANVQCQRARPWRCPCPHTRQLQVHNLEGAPRQMLADHHRWRKFGPWAGEHPRHSPQWNYHGRDSPPASGANLEAVDCRVETFFQHWWRGEYWRKSRCNRQFLRATSWPRSWRAQQYQRPCCDPARRVHRWTTTL